MGLSASLAGLGLELGRLKTGTPPRLIRQSIDFAKCDVQPGDEPVPWFSYWKDDVWGDELFHVEHGGHSPDALATLGSSRYPPGSVLGRHGGQLPCWITHTSDRTRDLILANLHKSPMYSGVIEGIGPRYCPSIEDKYVRFADKDRHQLFLEPEGIATNEIYVNGFSTSLPFEVQVEMVRTIVGCERAEILRPAYAVEYDFSLPTQLLPSLETMVCRNLFLAGQINGTSGYEEAGAQGLMAGINAARSVQGRPAVVLGRDEAYIGVLIDDLVTKGTSEPYRMFTSRAEYRLLLRQDNADFRLSELGHKIGLLPERNYRKFTERKTAVESEVARLQRIKNGTELLSQLLRRPEMTYSALPDARTELPADVAQQVEILIKYEGYLSRQAAEVDRLRDLESRVIPSEFPFESIPSLRNEARQKLAKIRPTTVGQATRISGVSPADVSLLLIGLRKWQSGRPSELDSGPQS
jgi:tRNA uridine 5-carboxymethylaminomethyl modification enzyme